MAAAQELTREWKEIAADPRFAGLPVETRQRLRKNWLQKFSQTPEFMAETPEKRQAFVDGFLAKDTSMVQGAGVSGAPVAPLVTPQVQPFTIPAGLSGIDPLSGKAPSPIPERQPYIVATPESSFLGPLAGKVLGGIGRGLNIAAGAIPAALVGLERAGAAAVEGVTGQELPPGGFERLYVQPEAQGSGLVDVAESAGANLLSALSLPTVVAQSAVNAFRRGVLEGKPEEAVTEITPIIDFLKSRSPEERQAVLEKVLDIAGKTEGQKLVAMLVADPLNVFGGAEAVSAAKRAGVGLKTAGKQAAQKLSEAQSLAQSGRIEEALSMLERDFPLRKPAPVEPPVAVREAPSVPISTELPASRVLPARPVEDVFQGVPPVERPPAAGKIPRRTRLEAQFEKTAVARQAVRTPLEAVAELSEERFAGAKVGVGELKKEVKTYLDSVIPSKDRQDSVIGAAYRKYTRSLSTASTPRAINELRDKIGRFVDSQLRKEKANEIFTLSKKALDSPGIAEADKEAVRDFMTHYRQTKPRDKWNWETAKKEILDANETGLIPTTLYEAPLSSQRMIKEKLEQVIAKAKENTAFRELQIKNEAMRVKAALKNKVVPVVLSDVNTENAIKNIAAKAKNFINRHDRAASTTDVVFDIFDGSPGTYDGPLSREIKDPIFAALNDSSQLTARAESVAEGIVFGIPSEGRRKLHRRLLVEQKNGIYSYVRDSNLTLAEAQKALNLPDEDFRFLWENGYLPYEKLNAALPLTPEETRAAGSFRVLYDSHHRAFNATLKRELGEVSGYIPNFYPLDNARHVKTSLEQVQSSIQRRGFFRANTEKNFIKARTEIGQKGRVEKILKTADGAELDMNVRYNPGEVAVEPEVQEVYKDYARRVNKFNALFPEKRRLNALLEDPEFVKMVGDEGAAYLKEFGETVILDRPLATGIETLEALGRNFSVARLALNAGTIFVQFPSSMATIAITGPEPLFQAATKWIREPSFRDFLLKNSAELRNRIGGGEVGLTDVFHPTAEAKVARAVAIGQASAMRPLQWADSTSAAFSMGAGYLDELAKAGLTHETATTPQRLAALNKGERVMRAVQGSTDVAKMPQMISRNKEFLGRINRLSFQFQTFPIQVIWNTLRHDLLRAGIYHKNPKAFTRAAQALFIIASGEALVRHGLDKLIDPAMPEEERVKIWRRALQNIGSSVPVFGKLLDLQYEPKAIPAVEPVISAGQSVAKLAKGEEKAQNAMRLIRALSEGIGVPVRPLEKDVRMAAGGLRILTDEEGIEKERLERERKLREKQRRKAMKERKEENREARQ